MKKKLLCLFTAGLLAMSTAATSASAAVSENGGYLPEEGSVLNRYYFYMPSEWATDGVEEQNVGVFWFSNGLEKPPEMVEVDWPGYRAEKGDADGVFYIHCPEEMTVITWNNLIDGNLSDASMSAQTELIGTEYYDPGECVLYPEGVDSFDSMIFVCDPTLTYKNENSNYAAENIYGGAWYYYYGNGQYGVYPTFDLAQKAGKVLSGDMQVISEAVEIKGDVNGDGELNISDATLIQRALAQITVLDEAQSVLADFDGDGSVTINDVTLIQKEIAG